MFHVRGLSYRYPKAEVPTIHELNFDIHQGEIFGLLGPSGVGKSTTQKILTKLIRDYEGVVKFRGKSLKDYDKQYFQQIGVGFEMPVHFSKLTAEENLAFFKKLYRSTADTDALLKRVGLYDHRKKKVREYSKGMKIRLNFVRALLNNPLMLFLDEPTNGLDPANARVIKEMIKEFRERGGTVLLTTHLMNDVEELCDRVAFMADGRIVEIDSPKHLKLRDGERTVVVEYEDHEEIKQVSFDLDQLRQNEEFIHIVQHYKILTMHTKETTLEDIFIQTTGVQAHE